jgi:hypothetical protein
MGFFLRPGLAGSGGIFDSRVAFSDRDGRYASTVLSQPSPRSLALVGSSRCDPELRALCTLRTLTQRFSLRGLGDLHGPGVADQRRCYRHGNMIVGPTMMVSELEWLVSRLRLGVAV